ncbi:MAG: hypothetical protein H7Y38_14225, partial [Armatimonadetes bacterium]|nr:hypothetical protein [Armatimonadota bacterium]
MSGKEAVKETMKPPAPGKRRRFFAGITFAVLALCFAVGSYFVGALPLRPGLAPDAPAEYSRFPWKNAVTDTPHPGVTRWQTRPATDGTVATLIRFDFRANPGLTFGIYDQDEDDAKPYDNSVAFWKRGVADAAMHLDHQKCGTVIAAW